MQSKLATLIYNRIVEANAVDDPVARSKIYDQFRERVRVGIALGRIKAEVNYIVSETIESIEKQMSSIPPSPLLPDFAEAKVSLEKNQSALPTNSGPSGKRRAILLGALAATLVASSGVYLYSLFGPATVSPNASAIQGTVDLSKFMIGPEGTEAATTLGAHTFSVADVDGVPTARIIGQAHLMSTEVIPVDVNKRYEIKMRLRIVPGANGAVVSTRLYAGAATYSLEGQLQTDAPGQHRYTLANNLAVNSSSGWIERTAVITGAGNSNHSQFRSGTIMMRLAVVPNYRSDQSSVVEIQSFSWRALEH